MREPLQRFHQQLMPLTRKMTMLLEASGHMTEDAPSTHYGEAVKFPADPREFTYVHISELEIDPNEQRAIDETRKRRIMKFIAKEFDWNKFEIITVRRTGAGHYKIVEGQGRILALKQLTSDVMVPCFVLPLNRGDAAAVASGIAQSRTNHSRHALWKLRLSQNSQYEVLVEDALTARTLRTGPGPSSYTIGAVALLDEIGKQNEPAVAARYVARTVDILRAAYPDNVPDSSTVRWSRPLMKTVYMILKNNDIVQAGRLSAVLAERPASQWVSIAKEAPEKDLVLYPKLIDAYNKRLHGGNRLV